MFSAPPSWLFSLILAEPVPADDYFMIWVVGAFLVLVGIFVVHQKGQSGWTWREFTEGMLALLFKILFLGLTMLAGHPHVPHDPDS